MKCKSLKGIMYAYMVKMKILVSSPEFTFARENLHHRIAGHLGALIAQGNLDPGSVLPNETSLGNEFGVSRTALREAIKVLAAKVLVEARRKTGTRVRRRSDWNVLDPEVLTWLFAGNEFPAGLTDLSKFAKWWSLPLPVSRLSERLRTILPKSKQPTPQWRQLLWICGLQSNRICDSIWLCLRPHTTLS
jgi:DNA-binding transcriptional MocR family regulator